MCLYIDGDRHYKYKTVARDGIYCSRNFNQPTAFIADQPLIVKKRVRRVVRTDKSERFLSPYQLTTINFGVILTSEMEARETAYSGAVGRVDRGHHAYLYNATTLDWRERSMLMDHDMTTIYAVIPAGARYYIGNNKEVVTNKIMYFRTLKLLREHFGITKVGKPVRGDYKA